MSRARTRQDALLRAASFALCAGAAVVVSAACTPEAPDVDLGKLKLAVWQPEALASGDGDLLDDAERVSVTLVVDGEAQEVTLDGGLAARDREAAAGGSDVEATLRTTGTTLPDALARSGPVQLRPDGGEVTVTALLAPPDVAHALSSSLPNGRTGMAVCASPDGRVWAIGGLLGASLASGSFVLDHAEREVREGPALGQLRAFAACVADDDGGVYLAGGCTADGTPVTSLAYSETGELGSGFVQQGTLAGAGCHTRLTRTDAGTLVALTRTHLHRIPADGSAPSSRVLPGPRVAAVLAAFPGDERVLVSGGFTDDTLTTPALGSLIFDVANGGEPTPLTPAFTAATVDGDALVVVQDRTVSRLSPSGELETVHTTALPFGFVPRHMAPLHDGRYALLDPDNTALRVVGAGAPLSIPLPAAREHLLSDPGGALLLFGGGAAGISLVVVE